jgi:uncharacterized protein (DUF2236 family)
MVQFSITSSITGTGTATPTAPRAAAAVDGLAGPRSLAWRINGEMVGLLGWGRAILLQVAHPLVAAGVAEHSHFSSARLDRVQRLQRTLNAMLTLTFGTRDEAVAVARHIDGIHGRVRGALREPAGTLPAGTPYFARNAELLRWVHATYVDSALRVYQLYRGPLSVAAQDHYCRETTAIAPLLRIPENFLPASTAELAAYMERMLAGDDIVVTDAARALARALLAPVGPPVLRPLEWLLQLPIAGLLPPRIRAAYGLAWSPRHARALALSAAASRQVLPRLPAALRRWPIARAAERRYAAARVAQRG